MAVEKMRKAGSQRERNRKINRKIPPPPGNMEVRQQQAGDETGQGFNLEMELLISII
jgi:hypothetical protein